MSCWRQGVVLLPKPEEVCSQHEQMNDTSHRVPARMHMEATFNGATGDIALGLLSFM